MNSDGRSLTTMQVNESSPTAQWSEWKIRPGVAFRHRLLPEISLHTVDIQYQLLISASPTRVTLSFCLYLSTLTMISGFFAQCLISRLFASFDRQENGYHRLSLPLIHRSHLFFRASLRSPELP
ncbi:unnamed protein product [Haemonchus placei]|uniref:Uncharacterized protein n=1 Tax=Haemonchus placei TaxID=6290 RepID=A0A3P7UWT9_HAEPC|nr:unnamed protein product [Haemonchus placei]